MWSTADGRPSRHARVYLDRAAWRRGAARPPAANAAVVDEWIDAGRPLVGRREDAALADPVHCHVAITLSPARGGLRIPLVIGRAAVVRIDPPLRLDEVVASAPDDRRDALMRLVDEAGDAGIGLFVYGSFAWQAMTDERYVTSRSDLDLLFDVRDDSTVPRATAMLLRWERIAGVRADGEARFANGDAVAWRELASGAARVLIKRDDGVRLGPPPGVDDIADRTNVLAVETLRPARTTSA